MSQLLATLRQIMYSDSVGVLEGFARHSGWQIRRVLNQFPCELPISHSRLCVESPGSVAALVNAMGEYDFNNMRLLRLVLLQGESTFFDIGANVGSYTLIASEIPSARVVSIEPHPATFAELERNVMRNARNNVLCLNLALSRVDGEVQLTDLAASDLNRVLKIEECKNNAHLPVRCRTLDSICGELGINPDFIKIDVEGHEPEVLDGIGDRITKPKMIFVEQGERQEVRRWMRVNGYTGPWFCHFKDRSFSGTSQGRPEDSIYLKIDFQSELRKLKFAVG